MGITELYKASKTEQSLSINKKVICMCPKMFDPRISETNSETPKFFFTSRWQPTTFMFWQNLKKIYFAVFEKFKGGIFKL